MIKKTKKLKKGVYAVFMMILSVFIFTACGSSGNESTKPNYDLGEISDSGEHGENIKWEYYADTATLVLSGEGEMPEEETTDYPWYKYFEDIKSIWVKSSITSISSCAFSGYENNEKIYLPESLEKIDTYAFRGNIRLSNVTIPRNVVSIGNYAFEECKSLTNLALPKSVMEIGKDSFSSCRMFHLYYSGTSEEFYNIDRDGGLNLMDEFLHFEKSGFDEKTEEAICFEPEGDLGRLTKSGECKDDYRIDDVNWEFYEESGSLLVKGNGYMNSWPGEDYNTPWGTQKKFGKKYGKRHVEVEEEALPIKHIYIMDGVQSVGVHAFANIDGIETVKISGSVKLIMRYAFDNNDIKEIVIAKGVEVIESNAILSNAVVKFTGTKEEWERIAGTEDINSEVIYNYKSND